VTTSSASWFFFSLFWCLDAKGGEDYLSIYVFVHRCIWIWLVRL
jgi:hypothetical protein